MEPIDENQPYFKSVTPNVQDQRSMNESMMEPIKKNPLFSQVSPAQPEGGQRDLNESQMEPIDENKPYFKSVTPNVQDQRSINESMIEPIKNNPLFS